MWRQRVSSLSLSEVHLAPLHEWCNKVRGMYHPIYGMMHIKEPLLLICYISLFGGIGFPLSLSEWSFSICLTPYNRN